MLADYVEWHLKQSFAPLLFEDEEIDDSSVDLIKASPVSHYSSNLSNFSSEKYRQTDSRPVINY